MHLNFYPFVLIDNEILACKKDIFNYQLRVNEYFRTKHQIIYLKQNQMVQRRKWGEEDEQFADYRVQKHQSAHNTADCGQ